MDTHTDCVIISHLLVDSVVAINLATADAFYRYVNNLFDKHYIYLKPNYKGPYVIDKVLNNNRYVVKDIPGFNITTRPCNAILSPDKLKPWIKI